MSVGTLRTVLIEGAWERLHRAESNVLANLLSASEQDAVNRRLGIPLGAPTWIPVSAGEFGGRFAEPHGPGALYLGNDISTCVKEIEHHHSLACAASTGTPPGTRAVFRHLVFRVSGTASVAVIVSTLAERGGLHDPSNYAPSWSYGRQVRASSLPGVYYRSVRQRGGRCLALLANNAVRFLHVVFGAVVLQWDGAVSRRIA